MQRTALILLAVLLAGCDAAENTTVSNLVEANAVVAAPDTGTGTEYRCTDGQVVRVVYSDPETLTLHYAGKAIAMKSAVSASGARYVGDSWQWWTKGLQQGTLAPLKPGETIASAPGVECRVA